jgi:Complex 1 protein (LYR family)
MFSCLSPHNSKHKILAVEYSYKNLRSHGHHTVMQLGSFRPLNREALHLYRDILRGCKRFHWCNEKGEPWSELLRQSARKEFEQAREENVSLQLCIHRMLMHCSFLLT